MSVFAAFVNGLTTEALGSTGLEEVEMAWLQEAHLGTGRGSFPRDVEHSRDPPERGTYRMRAPDPALQEDATEHHQTGTNSTQSSSAPQGHRAGRPSTADEQRAKKFRVNSSSAARKWRANTLRG